jgi:transcriptional repressor NrdR
MVCTYCGSETHVTNSRHQKRSNSVWRRRKCTACGAIFSTTEQADYEKSWVVQYPDDSSQRYAPFLRDKLFVSIYNSCRHRPAALDDAIGLTDTVIGQSHRNIQDGALKASDLAKTILTALRRFDQPAATSYQAFHADALTPRHTK